MLKEITFIRKNLRREDDKFSFNQDKRVWKLIHLFQDEDTQKVYKFINYNSDYDGITLQCGDVDEKATNINVQDLIYGMEDEEFDFYVHYNGRTTDTISHQEFIDNYVVEIEL